MATFSQYKLACCLQKVVSANNHLILYCKCASFFTQFLGIMTDTLVHFHWKHAQCFTHWVPGKLDMTADQADAKLPNQLYQLLFLIYLSKLLDRNGCLTGEASFHKPHLFHPAIPCLQGRNRVRKNHIFWSPTPHTYSRSTPRTKRVNEWLWITCDQTLFFPFRRKKLAKGNKEHAKNKERMPDCRLSCEWTEWHS